jgi:hypothetical protein
MTISPSQGSSAASADMVIIPVPKKSPIVTKVANPTYIVLIYIPHGTDRDLKVLSAEQNANMFYKWVF